MNPSDKISYQIAGMEEPKHGVIKSMARVDGYAFVRFEDNPNGELTPLDTCRPGHVGSWWFQDAKGRWWASC